MLKDDRMMGMLTFVVILIAFGTLIQRAEFFQRLFGPAGPPAELVVDEVVARATEATPIDVLANDANVGAGDAEKLTIVTPPACGRAFVRDGMIHYLGTQGCVGEQTVQYGLSGGEQTAVLRIAVEPATRPRRQPGTPARSAKPAAQGTEAEASAPGMEDVPAAEGGGAPPVPDLSVRSPAPATAEPGGDAETAPGGPAGDSPAQASTRTDPPDDLDTAAAPPGEAGDAPPRTAPADTAGTAEQPARECDVSPTLTLDLVPGAMTGVIVDSPCHAGTVAELAYDGLRFAIELDDRGTGSVAAPGFQGSAEAALSLEGREPMAFNLPFRNIERIDRVAVAWEATDGLALHALEFGARPGSSGHVSPTAPRSFEDVRRAGGGWLSAYEPAKGKGQRIEVYSFWRRHAGPVGVVHLGFDPGHPTQAADCEGAAAAGTDYKVLRSVAGHVERPRLGRIGAIDCTVLAGGRERYIGDAVDDLIVRRR